MNRLQHAAGADHLAVMQQARRFRRRCSRVALFPESDGVIRPLHLQPIARAARTWHLSEFRHCYRNGNPCKFNPSRHLPTSRIARHSRIASCSVNVCTDTRADINCNRV